MRAALAVCAALALAGCKEEMVTSTSPEDACGASQYQSLVGQDRAAVAEAGLVAGPNVRILTPGSVMTMDYRADRVNVELDEDDKVVRIHCG